jgi:hypothetical protein
VQQFKVILQRPFILKAGSFSQQEVTAGLAERAALVKWKEDALKDLTAIPATPDGFDRLEVYRAKGTADLAKLFPSEQQKFLDAVDERRKAQALGAAEGMIAAAKAVPPGFQGARQVTSMRAGVGRYLALLDEAGKVKVNAGLEEAMAVALRDGLAQQRAKLSSLPRGIDGALAWVAWRREFDLELTGIQSSSTDLASLRGEAMAKRRELLAQGLAEFKPLAAQYPKPGPRGKADELMAKLFPNPDDAGLTERQQYQSVLAARVSSIQAEESARRAKEDAARQKAQEEDQKALAAAVRPPVKTGKPPHQCDVLAAHPDDPNRVSDGVVDEKISTAAAIQQCSLAARQSPSTVRFHFQLGRAYFASKQYDKAIPEFLKAQEAKYAPAFFYLGEAYKRGLIKGEKADPQFAAELYQMAAAENFAPAILALGGTVGAAGPGSAARTGFDPKLFVHADWMKALLDGDAAKLNQSRLRALVYANGIQAYLSLDPNEFDSTCVKRTDLSLSQSLSNQLNGTPPTGLPRMPRDLNDLIRMAKAMQPPVDNVPDAETLEQDGIDDMNALSQNYGGCAGAAVGKMYATLKSFVREAPPARDPASERASQERAALPTMRLRPPEERDLRAGPALAEQAKKDLYVLAGQAQMIMECSYPQSKQTYLFWSKSIPRFSDALRGAFPAVAPLAAAACPGTGSVGAIFKMLTQSEASEATEQVKVFDPAALAPFAGRRGVPAMYPPRPSPWSSREAALPAAKQEIVVCRYPQRTNFPVTFWNRTLPLVDGQINTGFLEYLKINRGITPVAVDACPARFNDANLLQH